MLISLLTLTVGLSAYSLIVGTVNLTRLSAHIDQDLMQRARMVAVSGGPPPGARGGGLGLGFQDGGPPRPGFGPGVRGGRNGVGAVDPNAPPDQPPGAQSQEPRQDAYAPPGPDLRRPRFLDASGKMIGGFISDHAFDASLVEPALKNGPTFQDTVIEGTPARVLAVPWNRTNGDIGVLEVARDLSDYNDLKSTQLWSLIVLAPLAIALSAFGAFVLAGRAVRPLQVMQVAASRMGQGDLTQRLKVYGEDEVAGLARAMNAMASSLEHTFKEKEAAYENLREAYESQKRFTADASHELRTPLARMQLATSSALRGPEDGYKAALEVADSSAKAMGKLIRELLMLARADAGQLGLRHDVLDLRLVVSNALNAVPREIEACFPHSPVTINGDQDHLERVIINLLENAVRHTPDERPIRTSIQTKGDKAIVLIQDCGEGISPEHLPHLFDRFYRADAARPEGGIGLGLAISKSVVEAHGGTIRIDSELGHGTQVQVAIPLAE